jgi:hypothetical protein
MSHSDPDAVRLTRAAGVATITLQRPAAMNALTPAQLTDLGHYFDEVAANPDDRVLVLTGAGEAFCVGADLKGGGEELGRIAGGPIARRQFARETILPRSSCTACRSPPSPRSTESRPEPAATWPSGATWRSPRAPLASPRCS